MTIVLNAPCKMNRNKCTGTFSVYACFNNFFYNVVIVTGSYELMISVADPDPDLWIWICIIKVGSGSVWRDTNPDPDPGHIR